jgi:superfamily I DNA/RNA helicase
MHSSLTTLNPEQRKAASIIRGPVLILAGAGSGKTKTITHRIAYMISGKKIPASKILAVSFTNKAANELKQRVQDMVGKEKSKGLTICTFHRLALRMLRTNDPDGRPWSEYVGFRKNFTICDASDQLSMLKSAMRNVQISDRKFDAPMILSHISRAKNSFLCPNGYEQKLKKEYASEYELMTHSVYPSYMNSLKASNAMDFDDLLYFTTKLLEDSAKARQFFQDQFHYLMVDEYQDTNEAQFRLIKQIAGDKSNLCVVGDDDQSIYSWRGADSSHILSFSKQFPNAQIVSLTQNYRSTNGILKAANSVIKNNLNRHEKELWSQFGHGTPVKHVTCEDDTGEADWVIGQILDIQHKTNCSWSHFAILYRSNTLSRPFEEALRLNRIPYEVIGGMQFFERQEVKDIISYLKLICNPQDEASLRRVINTPPRRIGNKCVHRFDDWGIENRKSFAESLESVETLNNLKPAEKKNLKSFHELVSTLRKTYFAMREEGSSISEAAQQMLRKVGYKTYLDEKFKKEPRKATTKWENIQELIRGIEAYENHESKPKLQDYLTRISLSLTDLEKDDKKKNAVQLMSIHASKGLEFPTVFVAGAEEEIIPHKKTVQSDDGDISEERRLFYVSLTRAKKNAFITSCASRFKYGKKQEQRPSRFVKEIPEDLIQLENLTEAEEMKQENLEKRTENFLSDIFATLETDQDKDLDLNL